MTDLIAKLDIGISYIVTYIVNNLGSSQMTWDGPALKIKFLLNLISIVIALIALGFVAYGIIDKLLKHTAGADMIWSKKDGYMIVGGSIIMLLFLSTLLGDIVGGAFVYFGSK